MTSMFTPGPMLDKGQGQLFHTHTLWASSPLSSLQCQLCCAAQVRCRPDLPSAVAGEGVRGGPASLSATAAEGQGQLCAAHRYQHSPRSGESACPWCYHGPWPLIQTPAAAGPWTTHIRLFLTTLESAVSPLFLVHILLLFLSHLCTSYLFICSDTHLPTLNRGRQTCGCLLPTRASRTCDGRFCD